MKDLIFYHRAYRTVEAAPRGQIGALVALVLAAGVLLAALTPALTRSLALAVQAVLLQAGVTATLADAPFLPPFIPAVTLVVSQAGLPSATLSFAALAVSALLLLVLPLLRRLPRPLVVYGLFIAALVAVSAAYFLLIPRRFPNSVYDFSLLYVSLEVFLAILLPLMQATVLAPLPGGLAGKLGVCLATMAWVIVLASVRWAASLWLLAHGSVLFMATLFFALGPFFDFVGAVTLFSLYVNDRALRLARDPRSWQWLS